MQKEIIWEIRLTDNYNRRGYFNSPTDETKWPRCLSGINYFSKLIIHKNNDWKNLLNDLLLHQLIFVYIAKFKQ